MSTSKSAKKNARKREKKRLENLSKGKTDEIPLEDPVTALKDRLADAKANEDHKLAAKLRQDLWVLQDVSSGHEPSLDNKTIAESMERVKVETADNTTKPSQSEGSGSSFDKDLRRLRKKLDQIEKLKKKQENGEKLEESQTMKVKTESSIMEEIKEIEEILSSMKLKK